MKKQLLKKKTLSLLVEIHKGFLTKEEAAKVSDEEVLQNVPKNQGTFIHRADDTKEARVSAFTERWVRQRVKKDPDVTAEELLKSAGFK